MVLLAAGLVAGPGSRSAAAWPAADTGSSAAQRNGSSLKLGLQLFSMWRDWDTHTALMDAVVASGTTWLRVDVGWCSLEEQGPGVTSAWYLDRLDTTVRDARARGLRLLLTLTCGPAWATRDHTAGGYPTDPAQFRRIARTLATRYRGAVQAWEIWNEPDCIGGCPHGDPDAYLPVLRAGSLGVRAGDPAAKVLNGGLSGIDLTWIRALYDRGAARWVDALAVHPYLTPAAAAPSTPATPGWTNPYRITNVPALVAFLAERGHGGTPIWFTEFGWTTGRTPGTPYDGVTPAVQAQYLLQSVRMIARRYPQVTHAFWFTTRDRDDSSVYENGFGVLDLSGRPKPAYGALRQANAELRAR
ncbi:cellulase family glycosylhydrolase [Jatrophihabitans sp. YIM 134969]